MLKEAETREQNRGIELLWTGWLPFPAAHLNCGPLQELLKKLTGVNLPIWTAASGWTIKWLPEWPLLLSSSVFLPQTLSTFHLLHFSPLWFLLLIFISFLCHSELPAPLFLTALFNSSSILHLPRLSITPSFSCCSLSVCFCLSPCLLLRPACLLSVSIKTSLPPACAEEKEALKTKKSNCLLASNSPRHPLQPLLASWREDGEEE